MTPGVDTKGLESNEIGNFAVGCVSYLVRQSGFVWREMPGFDIGIDGEIEVVKKDNQPRAKIMVQVKGTTDPGVSVIKVDESRSHWQYWRAQRNPVLVCEVQMDKRVGDKPFNATNIRWVNISHTPTGAPSSNSSIPFSNDYGIEFLFSEATDRHAEWRKFIEGVVIHWPTTRIDSALNHAYLLLHSGKAKEALASVTGLEDSVVDAASSDQKCRLNTLRLKAERHGLPPREVRKKLPSLVESYRQQSVTDTALIREIGYWHVIAAMDPAAKQRIRVDLANEALKRFQKMAESNTAEKLEKADYILYAAMIFYMCENWGSKYRPKWEGAGRPEHIAVKHALKCYEDQIDKKVIGISEAERTLWRSTLLSGEKKRVQEIEKHQWEWFGNPSSSGIVTAQDYQDAVMLDAWSYFVLSDPDTEGDDPNAEDLSRARALLDAAKVGIRGCLPYYELDFWIAWIGESYPSPVS